MAIYRYIVTVETANPQGEDDPKGIENEIDSNLDSVMSIYDIEHFTVEPVEYVERDGYKERVIRSIEQ